MENKIDICIIMCIQSIMEKELNDTAAHFKMIKETHELELYKFAIDVENKLDNIIKYYTDLYARDNENMNTDEFIKNTLIVDLKHYSDPEFRRNTTAFCIAYPVFNSQRTILEDFCELLENNYIDDTTITKNKFTIVLKSIENRLQCGSLSYRFLGVLNNRKIQLLEYISNFDIEYYSSGSTNTSFGMNNVVEVNNKPCWIVSNYNILSSLGYFKLFKSDDKINNCVDAVFGNTYKYAKYHTEINDQIFLTIRCEMKC